MEEMSPDVHCPEEPGRLPAFHVEAGSVPEAYYGALRAVHFGGHTLRTQYDRRNSNGTFIDAPGKDARVTIRIRDPFAQPRFPALSYCERGKYIAEFLGAKDHFVDGAGAGGPWHMRFRLREQNWLLPAFRDGRARRRPGYRPLP